MLIGQISDCHVVEPGAVMADRVDPTPGLAMAVAYLNTLGDSLDLVIGTGDLVNDGRAAQYDQLDAVLGELTAPFLAIPGNHDDRTEMRARYGFLPGGGPDDPIDFVEELAALRLVCLDTNIPGRHDGRLVAAQLAWLDDTLAAGGDRATLVVQHHPPFASGIDSMDRFRLEGDAAEAEVLARHDHVVGVISGHYHRAIHRTLAATGCFACPSTAVQLIARLGPGPTTYSSDPPALALHEIGEHAMTTHLVQLVEGESWVPSWADAG